MMESTELIALPPKESALEVFTGAFDVTVAPLLVGIKRAVDAFAADATTEDGRAAIKSFDYRLARSKTALDAAGKALNDELKAMPRKIDDNRRRAREQIEAWQSQVRRPLTEWEDRENERKAKHVRAVGSYRALMESVRNSPSDIIRKAIEHLPAIPPEPEEFAEEYRVAREDALARLGEALTAREAADTWAAENARLRAAQAEQEAKLAEAERARREAERRATEAATAQARAVQAQLDAERRAAEDREAMERQRKTDEERRERAEAERKAAEERVAEARAESVARVGVMRAEAIADLDLVLIAAGAALSKTGKIAVALMAAIEKGSIRNVVAWFGDKP
jgi:peptidoglycan DL-endopeptidase RipA